ncbi:hypothetical protein [Magnetospirillum sp. UT-4]|uniref:hypothetical protein n=1 Tax=Magnetospirillum sp. UT-4 TaxID=2681467 RepID=UPI00138209BA|nr:hypothetical protein [Magnetospirillum sp. UT-4]CAA7620092.1 conserved exported hypothetical protein [Magnetospirillum sp. UT-4]
MARRRIRRGQQGWQIWFKLFKFAVVLAAFGATGFYAYEVGQRLALDEVAAARQEIERLSTAEAARRGEAEALAAELEAARARAADFQAKYEAVAPTDEMKDLTAALKAKLASGLEPKRLAFVIHSAEKPRRCGGEETKRFMVKTARYDGNSTWVRFSDLITVTADGAGGNGGAEQWYDPDKPVTLHFTAIGGKDSQASGKLPLQHSLVVKNGEYRFTAVPGARGFIEITGDRCEYRG